MPVSLQNLILLDHKGVRFNPLDQCMLSFNARTKKGYNEVSFSTDAKLDNRAMLQGQMRMEKLGLVVWLDRDKVRELLASKTPEGMDVEHEGPLRSLHFALKEALRVSANKALLPGVDLNPLMDNLDQLFGEAP